MNRRAIMSQPTPTPWKLRPTKKSGATYTHEIEDALGNFVGAFDVSYGLPAMHEANAAFIVTSCNSHAALLEACKDTLAILEAVGFGGSGNNARERQIEKQLRAAISLAEGRPA